MLNYQEFIKAIRIKNLTRQAQYNLIQRMMPEKKQQKTMQKIVGSYWLQDKIGSGAFSQVFVGHDMRNLNKVAIKVINSKKIVSNPHIIESIKNEIRVLVDTKESPYIIKFLDYMQTKNNFYFVYQYCSEGNLAQLIKKQQFICQTLALEYFRQLLEGFRVLVSLNIIHRDVKPENILLKDGKLKIADFGFCKILEGSNQMMMSMMGTPLYMAPEVIHGDIYTGKCDIYSLGVVLYKMLYGKCPYQARSLIQMLYQLENNQLAFPKQIQVSSDTKHILSRMLQKNQQKRANWPQIFSHFFQTEKFSEILADSTTPLLIGLKQQQQKSFEQTPKNPSTNLKDSETTLTDTASEHLKSTKPNQQQISQQVLSSQQASEQLYTIQTLIEKHTKILEITDIILTVLKVFKFEQHMKIVRLCVEKLDKQLLFLRSRISNEKKFQQIRNLLSEHVHFLSQIKLKTSMSKIKLTQAQKTNVSKLIKSIFKKAYPEGFKSLDKSDLKLPIRLVNLLQNNLIHDFNFYEQIEKDGLLSILCAYES